MAIKEILELGAMFLVFGGLLVVTGALIGLGTK